MGETDVFLKYVMPTGASILCFFKYTRLVDQKLY
jgi:hypothetical protein